MHTRGTILEKVMTNYVSMVKWSHRKKIKQPPNSPAHLNSFLMKSNTDHSANFIKKKKWKCAEHYNNKWKCDSVKCSDALP